MEKNGFPIFDEKFYVESLKLDFWPPFCYRKSDFHFFFLFLVLLDYFISATNLIAKSILKSTFLS